MKLFGRSCAAALIVFGAMNAWTAFTSHVPSTPLFPSWMYRAGTLLLWPSVVFAFYLGVRVWRDPSLPFSWKPAGFAPEQRRIS